MSRTAEEYRAQADKARALVAVIADEEFRRAALAIAEGWEQLAKAAELKPPTTEIAD